MRARHEKPLKYWWAGRDSNPQPDRYERPALTIELPARRCEAEASRITPVSWAMQGFAGHCCRSLRAILGGTGKFRRNEAFAQFEARRGARGTLQGTLDEESEPDEARSHQECGRNRNRAFRSPMAFGRNRRGADRSRFEGDTHGAILGTNALHRLS